MRTILRAGQTVGGAALMAVLLTAAAAFAAPAEQAAPPSVFTPAPVPQSSPKVDATATQPSPISRFAIERRRVVRARIAAERAIVRSARALAAEQATR